MTSEMAVLVGTVGQGVMRSPDGGDTWKRVSIKQGLHSDATIRTLANHPGRPETVYAGSDRGLYRSDDAGDSWRLLDTALNGKFVWALAVDPVEPDVVFAGTGTPTPAGIFRSTDGGERWEQRPVDVVAECPAVGTPRVTGIAIDPDSHRSIWASIEVDGVRHSTDGGDTWVSLEGAIENPDAHNVTVTPGPPKTVIVVVNNDILTSTDDGATWDAVGIAEVFPLGYPRGIRVRPDDTRTIFVTIGDSTPGSIGTVMRSPDAGKSWEELSLPVQPNSAMWVVNAQPFAPQVVFAGSRFGYLYRSGDGGDSWEKLWREFSEITSVLTVPV